MNLWKGLSWDVRPRCKWLERAGGFNRNQEWVISTTENQVSWLQSKKGFKSLKRVWFLFVCVQPAGSSSAPAAMRFYFIRCCVTALCHFRFGSAGKLQSKQLWRPRFPRRLLPLLLPPAGRLRTPTSTELTHLCLFLFTSVVLWGLTVMAPVSFIVKDFLHFSYKTNDGKQKLNLNYRVIVLFIWFLVLLSNAFLEVFHPDSKKKKMKRKNKLWWKQRI